MAQENTGAVSAVPSIRASSRVSGVGADDQPLPSQEAVNIATGLASAFKQPESKIPEIAQAVEGLINPRNQGQAVGAFRKLAELLGLGLEKPKGADTSGAPEAPKKASGTGDDAETLLEKLIKMLKAQGLSDAQIRAMLGPILQALGKSPDEATALLDKLLGDTQGTEGGTDPTAASAARFNRG